MRESKIEAYLVAKVKAMGGEVRKVQFTGRRGAPDRLVMLPPLTRTQKLPVGILVSEARTAIWVELKATGIKAEPHQVREHTRMRKMGQRVEVVDSFHRADEVLS